MHGSLCAIAFYDMKTIIFKGLSDDKILDIVDPAIPYILIPGFRPHPAIEWWTTDIHLNSKDTIENVKVRDLSVDLMTDKRTVEQIFKVGQFNQIAFWQFKKPIPNTLKIDELRPDTVDKILIHNGLVNRIWVNYDYVEFSSIDDNYLTKISERYKDNLR